MPAAAATLDSPNPAPVPELEPDARELGGIIFSRALARARLAGFGLWSGICLLVMLPLVLRGKGLPPRYVRMWHRGCLRILGIRVKISGAPLSHGSGLLVSNHISYLDILILGSSTLCSFVSKAEVRTWPVFGLLARQQRTIFIERKRSEAKRQREELERRIRQGDRLILFPEGTTSDGQRTLDFKTSLFDIANIEAADGRPVPVQPVTIAYTHLDGMPLGRWLRPLYAWYGDMELAPHMMQWLGVGRLEVEVTFHEPVRLSEFESRKHLAEYCQHRVADGLSLALTGGNRRALPKPKA